MINRIVKSVLKLLPKTRKSNPLSKMLRPLLESKRVKSFFGIQIAGVAMFAGVVSYPAQSFDYNQADGAYIDASQEMVIETESTFQFPLKDYYGVSQGYSYYHPGYDIRAPRGSEIYPVSDGVVVEKEMGLYGYGHYVVIDHENDYQTLYAHMDRVYVNVGDNVGKESVIGEVGLTGWTTGYHLHFETMREGLYVSPYEILK